MAKVYVSPSTQEHNAYAGGGNEETEMRKTCALICALVQSAGHAVKMGGAVSATSNADDGNAWMGAAGWYVSVHSNAGGGKGTEVWCYTGSSNGKRLADAIYNRLAPVTHSPDRGVKSSTGYIELRRTKAPAVIVEIAFHDFLPDAQEIKTHHTEHARAIAQGILDVIGGAIPAPVPPPIPPPPPVSTGTWKVTGQDDVTITLKKG